MWHALLTAATVAALGCGAWYLVALVRIVLDVVFAREGREPALWPDPDSVTVWTGNGVVHGHRDAGRVRPVGDRRVP